MTWGILGALDEEIDLIRQEMDIEKEEAFLETVFYIGTYQEKQVVLACCGVGKVNATICATTLIQRYGADCVINVGIAGAMDKDLKVLDVVIAREVCFHDQDPVMLKYTPKKEFFRTDDALFDLCVQACTTLKNISSTVTCGRIATGDVFVSDKETKKRIEEAYHPACVEMEGAAIGHTCSMHNIPFLIIRSMSDSADDEATQTYDTFLQDAAKQSAMIILAMLEIEK